MKLEEFILKVIDSTYQIISIILPRLRLLKLHWNLFCDWFIYRLMLIMHTHTACRVLRNKKLKVVFNFREINSPLYIYRGQVEMCISWKGCRSEKTNYVTMWIFQKNENILFFENGWENRTSSWRWGENYIRRVGVEENKEDRGLMIVFSRLLRNSERNTELYRGILYNI